MHHYLGLEFPRICKLLGVTLLIGRAFHIGQIFPVGLKQNLSQGLLNRWTSQLDLGITAGGLERTVSVHNST